MNPIEGIHHITLITGDAPGNVDFYARVLGLRLVKKTVNQDDPGVYHLFYADENGSPGADITFFEYPGAAPGRAGAGMISRIVHRVASEDALDFWEERLGDEGVATEREPGRLLFADPEGMGHELAVVTTTDAPLIAASLEVPAEFALQGFEAVRAKVARPGPQRGAAGPGARLLRARAPTTGRRAASTAAAASCSSSQTSAASPAPAPCTTSPGRCCSAELAEWQRTSPRPARTPTPVIDRFYFQSVYFREPGGILYELATLDGAGFASDEAPEDMGQGLSLPPFLEQQPRPDRAAADAAARHARLASARRPAPGAER